MRAINRNIFILMTGSGMAQILNFLVYLFLAKIYGPSNFGIFGIFTAIFFVLAELANAKIDQSIMLPKIESEALALTKWSILIGLLSSVLIFTITIFFHLSNVKFIQGISNKELMLLPIGLLFFAIWQSLQVYCNRCAFYKTLSLARVIQVLITGVFSFLFFKNAWNVNGLVLGFILGWAGAIFILLIPTYSTFAKNADLKFLKERSLLKQYIAFPKFGSLSALVNTLSRYLPYYFLMLSFGSAMTGQYTLAHKTLFAPVGIIGGAIGQVFYKEAAQVADSKIYFLAKRIILRNFLLAIIPTLIVFFFGTALFEWIFGIEWKVAGRTAQILILWVFMTFLSGPVSTIIDLKQELRWELIYNLILLLFRALALIVGVYFQQFFTAIIGYALVGVIFNLVILWKMKALLKT